MKVCPKCNNVLGWNDQFHAYYCNLCGTMVDENGVKKYGKGNFLLMEDD